MSSQHCSASCLPKKASPLLGKVVHSGVMLCIAIVPSKTSEQNEMVFARTARYVPHIVM